MRPSFQKHPSLPDSSRIVRAVYGPARHQPRGPVHEPGHRRPVCSSAVLAAPADALRQSASAAASPREPTGALLGAALWNT
ncbi:hypothetical protein AB0B15_23760 [Streptomyces sp. NPDC045456]|uniref:hypothetical protein n=1 Tax=Streptomyces sp. NPDC045456 TaxID=3155254 RepID=UPI00340B4A22